MTETKMKRNRRVWAAITRDPQATLDKLGAVLGYTKSMIRLILKDLRSAGYIDYQDRTNGARTILVPFVEVRQNDAAA